MTKKRIRRFYLNKLWKRFYKHCVHDHLGSIFVKCYWWNDFNYRKKKSDDNVKVIDDILKANVRRLGRDRRFIFQQGNEQKHTS